MDEPVIDFGDFAAGSPVTEIGRWCEDQVRNFPPAEGRHPVAVRDVGHEYHVTFNYPYVEISVRVDKINGIGTPFEGEAIEGTCSEIEFIEATRTVLTFEDFEAE